MRPDGDRDPVAGPDSGPQPPFPIRLSGPVIRGFGRGSKELGIPTANIPPGPLDQYPDLATGVYYGLVALLLPFDGSISQSVQTTENEDHQDHQDHQDHHDHNAKKTLSKRPAVLSIGYNPFYGNQMRSIEIHILQPALSSSSSTTTTTKPYPFPTSSSTSTSYPPPPPPLPAEFYNAPLNLLILGFIRPEYDYVNRESLIDDIHTDCRVARRSLERDAYRSFESEETEEGTWLADFGWAAVMQGG